jgi:hypothetical protein
LDTKLIPQIPPVKFAPLLFVGSKNSLVLAFSSNSGYLLIGLIARRKKPFTACALRIKEEYHEVYDPGGGLVKNPRHIQKEGKNRFDCPDTGAG